jgi:CRISPR-associated protein Cmx8
VPFKDLARFQFLLHFWAFVSQIYVPLTWTFDRKTKSEKPKDVGFALVIPDIADLETFCDELPAVLQSRLSEKFGYRPRESAIDVAAEGALDLMHKINQRLATKVNQVSDLLLGVDVVHLEKQGNNIRLWGNTRIYPSRSILDKYQNAKEKYKNQTFRRQIILNILNEKDWSYGFDSLLSKTDFEQTVGNSFFRNDVRKAFEDVGVTNISKGAKYMETQTTEKVPKKLEEVVYDLVSTYVREKVRNKYQSEWSKLTSDAEKNKHNELRGKVAREAFLAVRSRTDDDFIEYFTSSICSYHQFSLKGDGFDLVAEALYDEEKRAQVRTLTMLALSANGYSPKSEKQGEIQ